ncbi:MAG: DUF2917 domain-containing protein [Cytophagales bacterium]|nr:DUF2917 domain-containing protein [Rhizobacter sp.]
MRLTSAPQTAHLQRNQTFNLRARKGQRVEVRTGQVWITQDGDPRDVILDANQCFTLDRSGHALVSALEDASFVLRDAAEVAKAAAVARRTLGGALAPSCAY